MNTELSKHPIIDTHQHLWDLDQLELAWLNDPAFKSLARDFLLDDYAVATTGFHIVRTIYLEVDAKSDDQAAEAKFITQLAQSGDSRIAGAVFGARPAYDDFNIWLKELVGNPLAKGVREVLFDRPTGHCLERQFIRGIRRLGENGMLFEIEIPPEQLLYALTLVDACPETQFVLDHCGHPKLAERDMLWEYAVTDIAKRKNVSVKISGLFSGASASFCTAEAIAPALNHLLATFGPDRVLFGSDWPVVTLTSSFAAWAEAVWQVVGNRSDAEVRKLFHDNAVVVYRLN